MVAKAREDQIAYDSTECSAHCGLAIEERQSFAELKARIIETEVRDGDRVKASFCTR
jgi:hypothetical protein